MECIVIRGGQGTVVWIRESPARNVVNWVCTRDGFSVTAPRSPADMEKALLAIAQHSATLTGTLAQVVQLTL